MFVSPLFDVILFAIEKFVIEFSITVMLWKVKKVRSKMKLFDFQHSWMFLNLKNGILFHEYSRGI